MTTSLEKRALAKRTARNVQRERKMAGLSIYELSARTEIDIGVIEQGERLPTLETAQKLAIGLSVELDQLITDIEWRPAERAFFVEGERVG